MIDLLKDVSEGMAYAHKSGLLHLDMRPPNILGKTHNNYFSLYLYCHYLSQNIIDLIVNWDKMIGRNVFKVSDIGGALMK